VENSKIANLAHHLPPLGARVQEINPLIRARLYIPGSRRSWYLVAAGRDHGEIVFFGTESRCHYQPHTRSWRRFPLSFFERVSVAVGSPIAIDETFQLCRYTDLTDY
jgi:hypothetical protein